jgi:xanthine dehydrogenase accessory factor
MDDILLYEEVIALYKSGIPSALATVVESAGSSPRKPGAKMLVRSDGSSLGTIGGGKVELETIETALSAIRTGLPRTISFNLTEEHGHVCGGMLLVYIDPVCMKPHLLIIGAGHVGKALSTAAKFAGFRVSVADDRPDYADRNQIPDADETFTGDPAGAMARFSVDFATSIVISTTGFEKDFAAAREALKTDARYIGIIGSRRKREVLVQTLTAEGYPPDTIERLKIPVGLPIGAETPAEIAVSIVAQLIEMRRKHATEHVSDSSGRRTVEADGTQKTASAAS